jgi:hypothetical protein
MRVFTSVPAASVCISALALALLGAGQAAAQQPSPDQIAAIKSSCRSDFMSKCWGVPRGGTEAFQCLKKNLASLSATCQQAVNAAIASATPPSPPSSTTGGTPAAPTSPPPAAAAKTAAPETAPPASSNTASPAQNSETKTAAPAESEESQPAAAAKPASGAQAATSSASGAAAKVAVPTMQAPKKSSSSAATAAKAEAPAAAEPTSVKKPSETQAAAPAEPDAAPVPGFIPPRKKLMVLRNCRQDLDAYCPGVSYGEGRQLRCLESNRATLSPDCQGALAKLAQ